MIKMIHNMIEIVWQAKWKIIFDRVKQRVKIIHIVIVSKDNILGNIGIVDILNSNRCQIFLRV